MFECHFGVPMTGAVVNTLNTRLDAEAIAFMLAHGEAKVLITDLEFSGVIKKALELLKGPKPVVIDSLDPDFTAGEKLGEKDYEGLLAEGDPNFAWQLPEDEWDRRLNGFEHELYEIVYQLGGRLSGEHGIGYKRKDLMQKFTDPVELDMMRRIKLALDPNLVLNPGKIFDIE